MDGGIPGFFGASSAGRFGVKGSVLGIVILASSEQGAPVLTVVYSSPQKALLRWQDNGGNWTVQESRDLSGEWSDLSGGEVGSIEIAIDSGVRFFRLHRDSD